MPVVPQKRGSELAYTTRKGSVQSAIVPRGGLTNRTESEPRLDDCPDAVELCHYGGNYTG